MYKIKLGVPEMKSLWENLSSKVKNKTANKDEEKQYKKIGKALKLLSENPRYPGLQTHEIDSLSNRYGLKVWESYLENNTPRAGRIFWVYGPEKKILPLSDWNRTLMINLMHTRKLHYLSLAKK